MKVSSFTPILFMITALMLWEIIVRLAQIPAYLLPPPSTIIKSVEISLLGHTLVTFAEALAGFALASITAYIAALLFVRSPTLERGLFPIAIALKTTPLVAIAPLLVLWMGTGWWSNPVSAFRWTGSCRRARPRSMSRY